jgi:hypothetical protein
MTRVQPSEALTTHLLSGDELAAQSLKKLSSGAAKQQTLTSGTVA